MIQVDGIFFNWFNRPRHQCNCGKAPPGLQACSKTNEDLKSKAVMLKNCWSGAQKREPTSQFQTWEAQEYLRPYPSLP